MDFYLGLIQIIGVHTLLGLSAYCVLLTGQVSLAQAGFFAIGAYVAGMLTVLAGWPIVPALIVAATGAVFQQVQADERASLASFEAALSQGVGDAIGALILLIAVAGGVALVTARRASSAARPAAES